MASPDVFSFTWTRFFYTVVNFLILVGVLYKLLHKPLMGVLARRQKAVEDAHREADDKAREADAARKEYEERIAGIEEERDRMLAEARERSEKARQDLVEKARAEAEREVANLKRDWERQRRDALKALESDIVGAGLDLAGRVLGRLADGDVEARLHEQLLAQLAELQVSVTAGPVRVVSARALSDDARAAIRERTVALCGGSVDVSFDVDESLIAGTRVEFSSQAVDATLADAVAAVRERFGELAPGPGEEADA